MKSPRLVAAAALAIFAVAACGGSSTAPTGAGTPTAAPGGGTTTTPVLTGGATTTPVPTAGTVDQCALLSPADLKTVTGNDWLAGALDSVGRCRWEVRGVNVYHEQVVAYTHTLSLSTFKSDHPGGVDVTVSGHAGYRISVGGNDSFWVDVDGRTLVLHYDSFPPGRDGQAIAQKLAEIAIGNM